MPYLPETRKTELKADPTKASEPGDFNYLFTLCYLEYWLKPGNQRYATIHRIKTDAELEIGDISENITGGLWATCLPIQDMRAAKRAAYDEFRRRVVEPYEEYCIAKNGDIDLYEQADLLLNNKYGETQK